MAIATRRLTGQAGRGGSHRRREMLILFHDYVSPASAVAVARLHRLTGQGVPVEFVGFEAIGIDMLVPVTLDVLTELEQVTPAAAAEGVLLRRPAALPPTGLAHVVEDEAAAQGRGDAWRAACYATFWTHGTDLSDPAVLRDIARDADLDGDRVDAAIGDRVRLAGVHRRTSGHRRNGVGGVPTILAHRTLVPGLLPDDDLRALASL